ncbi:MAG: HpnA protein [Pirellulaceae bacterium]|nr:MAG: HpnA protein [Pirellulaceae bacterium]
MIFVTGATGFLGNCVVRELCRRGEAVRVLCRPEASRECFTGLPVEIVEGDLSNTHGLIRALEGCRAAVHCAALIHIGWHQLERSREVNVGGTRRLAEACLAHQVRMVHVSTVDTLPAATTGGRPIDETGSGGVEKVPCSYVISKQEAEFVVREFIAARNLDAVIVHPGFMLGPYDWKPSSGRMLLEVSRLPVVAAPRGGCSVCDARDVAHAVANAIDHGQSGENFILAGENLTYQELWKRMLHVAGRRAPVFRLGPAVSAIGKIIDLTNRLLPIQEGDVNGAMIAMGNLKHFYSSQKAHQHLQYRNRDLNETLQDAWDWLQRRRHCTGH